MYRVHTLLRIIFNELTSIGIWTILFKNIMTSLDINLHSSFIIISWATITQLCWVWNMNLGKANQTCLCCTFFLSSTLICIDYHIQNLLYRNSFNFFSPLWSILFENRKQSQPSQNYSKHHNQALDYFKPQKFTCLLCGESRNILPSSYFGLNIFISCTTWFNREIDSLPATWYSSPFRPHKFVSLPNFALKHSFCHYM